MRIYRLLLFARPLSPTHPACDSSNTSSCDSSILQEGSTCLGRPTGRLGSSGPLPLAELRRLSRMISPMSRVTGLTNLGALSFGKFLKIYAVRAINEGRPHCECLRVQASVVRSHIS